METINIILNSIMAYLKLFLQEVLLQGLNLPTLMLFILFSVGIYLTFLKGTKTWINETLHDFISENREEDKLFLRTGIKIKANQYELILYGIAVIIVFWAGVMSIKNSSPITGAWGILISMIVIFFFQPREQLLGLFKSPFVYMLNKVTKSRQESLDKELYNSVITLKNLAIAQEEQPLSADLIFEKLMDNSRKLKPIYAEMLNMYRTGDIKGAFDFFADSIGTKNAKAFSLELEKMDKINPSELKASVTSIQEVMAEERYTKGLEKAERNGNLTYLMASAVCFICILNFAVVVVMMDALNMMTGLF